MKNKNSLVKSAALFIAAAFFQLPGFAQSNLGASCGCPPVATRPTVNLSTRATYVGLPNDFALNATNTVLSCDTTYILDQKIYIGAGKTITILPGTVIKGLNYATTDSATALIIQKDGKIYADGTKECPIVFTTVLDNLSGSYGLANRGKWGGLVLLGKAKNNLTLAANGPAGSGKYAVADGIGYLEGFNFANGRNQYGMAPGQEDDNDNSGVLRYVSVRHGGALLALAGNELNGIAFGSVGRGTTVEHIEVISNDDDGVELFGGTVNLKYVSLLFGADDMLDYDQGWTGKAQFVFGIKSDNATAPSNDNGIEADNDDNKSANQPYTHPVIYNATFIGDGNNTSVGDNSGPFAINCKEYTQGEIYNSVFANFKSGFNMTKALTGTRTAEAYDNWIAGTLKVKCNTFVANTDSITVDKLAANVLAGDRTKFTADGNSAVTTLAGFDYVFTANSSTNSVSHQYDASPSPAVPVNQSGCSTAPVDGFFTFAPYRGAFDPNGDSWLSEWSYSALIKSGVGLVACPTDINNDGITNNADFLDLLGKFNQSCE